MNGLGEHLVFIPVYNYIFMFEVKTNRIIENLFLNFIHIIYEIWISVNAISAIKIMFVETNILIYNFS